MPRRIVYLPGLSGCAGLCRSLCGAWRGDRRMARRLCQDL